MLQLLVQKYQSEIDLHIYNIHNLINHRVGVAEHPDLAATIEMELRKIAELSDLIEAAQLTEEELKSIIPIEE